jgi:hypothetical protein
VHTRSTGKIIDTIRGSFHIFIRERDNNKHQNVSFVSLYIYNIIHPKNANDILLSHRFNMQYLYCITVRFIM